MIVDFALNDDPFLDQTENDTSLNNRFAALYTADWDDRRISLARLNLEWVETVLHFFMRD